MRLIRTSTAWVAVATLLFIQPACSESEDSSLRDAGGSDAGDAGDGGDAGEDATPIPEGSWSREWSFERVLAGGGRELIRSGLSVGEAVDEREILGGLELVPETRPPSEAQARLEVFGPSSFEELRLLAEAQNRDLAIFGGVTTFRQIHRLRRTNLEAAVTLSLDGLLIEALDDVPTPPGGCAGAIRGEVDLTLVASVLTPTGPVIIQQSTAFVALDGCRGAWTLQATGAGSPPLWGDGDFDFEDDVDGQDGRWARVQIPQAILVELPIEDTNPNDIVFIDVTMVASAMTERGPESYVTAGFDGAGGLTIDFSGLTFEPGLLEVDPDPKGEEECSVSSPPDPGELVLASPEFFQPERHAGQAVILVNRIGGNDGEASATVTVRGGSASEDQDYESFEGVVTFGDGWSGTQAIKIPVNVDGVEEDDETVELELVRNGGCAAVGDPSTAVLNILDAESRLPEEYRLGGTVSGLQGGGLQLRDFTFGDTVDIDANGPFQLPQPRGAGLSYNVGVSRAPTNPPQSCLVTNGAGQMPEADVTDIQVTCEALQIEPTLDATFGTGGKVTTDALLEPGALVIQTDGKIVAITPTQLVRLESTGALDLTFSDDGKADLLFGLQSMQGRGVALQADGKIVAVGQTRTMNGDDFIIGRFNENGTVDTSFGTGGFVIVDFEGQTDRGYVALLQSDGKIVAVGQAGRPGFDNEFALVRLNGDGTVDTTFGTSGRVLTNLQGQADLALDAVVLSDDRILVVGQTGATGNDRADVGLVRYLANGALDTTFGPDQTGIVESTWGGSLDTFVGVDVDVSSAGDIYVGVRCAIASDFFLGAAKYDADGTLDTGFGDQGLATVRFSETDDPFMGGLVVQLDGKPVVVGGTRIGSPSRFGLARFQTDGTLDPTFDGDGRVEIDLPGDPDSAHRAVLDAQGRIIVGGTTRVGFNTTFSASRHLP